MDHRPAGALDAGTPELGRAIRDEWALDPGWLTVNHGAFGATPRVVLAAQDAWRGRMEAQPTRFMARELPSVLREAAAALAAFVGAVASDIVFVDNATAGCNAVLRSLDLAPGDEILVLDHGYAAVRNAARHVASGAGARVTEAALPFPRADDAAIVAAVAAALTPRTRLAIIDHITSPTALVLPVAHIVAVCHAAGVPVLVDGAHGPGQVTLDLHALGADWYAGNCHKWLMAPKGCGFLWAAPDRQAGLHPVVVSHGYGQGFLAEFDWTGTRDPSAFLAVEAAIAFHRRLGGASLRARNRALAAEAGALLAARLRTEVAAAGAGAGAMGAVRLPWTGAVDAAAERLLRARLMELGTDAPVHRAAGALWLRVSAAAYNELDDYVRLADIMVRALG